MTRDPRNHILHFWFFVSKSNALPETNRNKISFEYLSLTLKALLYELAVDFRWSFPDDIVAPNKFPNSTVKALQKYDASLLSALYNKTLLRDYIEFVDQMKH